MADDDKKPEPQSVPTGRFKRMFAMGKLGASLSASKLTSKIKGALGSSDSNEDFINDSAERIVSTLGNLKGASMKVGQFLSTDPELLPQGLAEKLTSLQNNAPPMNFDTICSQIQDAFNLPIDAIFSYFSAEPVGAASIGQVHRATLADSNQDVAVKIQYPGVIESLEDDLKSLESLMNFGLVVMSKERKDAFINEIRDMVLQEANYIQEAENLRLFNEICKDQPGIRVPLPIEKWTRKTVLTMEFMEGVKLDTALEQIDDPVRRNKLLHHWVTTYIWMFHEQHHIHADPHPGNFLLADDDTLVILDFGSVKKYEPAFTDKVLEFYDAVWQDDPYRILDLLDELGFGGSNVKIKNLDPEAIRELCTIMFEPYYSPDPFDFGAWQPARANRAFMMRNKLFLRLTPPPESLQYFRILSGIKGLLARFNGELSVTKYLMQTSKRRNILSAEPRWTRLAELRKRYIPTFDDTDQ